MIHFNERICRFLSLNVLNHKNSCFDAAPQNSANTICMIERPFLNNHFLSLSLEYVYIGLRVPMKIGHATI